MGQHLEHFFDLIFYCLESDNALCSYAAEDCLHKLSAVLGPNILKGRIENYNPRHLELYNRRGMNGPGSGLGGKLSTADAFGGQPTMEPGLGLSSAMSIPGRADTMPKPSLGG